MGHHVVMRTPMGEEYLVTYLLHRIHINFMHSVHKMHENDLRRLNSSGILRLLSVSRSVPVIAASNGVMLRDSATKFTAGHRNPQSLYVLKRNRASTNIRADTRIVIYHLLGGSRGWKLDEGLEHLKYTNPRRSICKTYLSPPIQNQNILWFSKWSSKCDQLAGSDILR